MSIKVIDTIEPKTSDFKVVDAKNVGYNGGDLVEMLQGLNSPNQFSYCSNNKIRLTKHLNVFSAEKSLSSTIYWPWLIKVEELIENPLGKYYLYYSTDHGQTTGYISMAYSDNILGPFTDYGQIYKNSTYETETPSVMWDEYNNQFIMYFHCSGSHEGEAQTSYYVTSKDGITYDSATQTKLFDLDTTKLFGNLHNGYFHPFRAGDSWFGYSLMGGNNGGGAVSYSEDGYSWITDHNQLGYHCLKGDHYIPLHHGTIVSKWGMYWWIGLRQNFASGTESKTGSVVMIPMQDLYTPIGQPEKLFDLEDTVYEDANIRQVTVYEENGILYVWYQCGNYFNVAVISDKSNTDSNSNIPIEPDDPTRGYTTLITCISDKTIDNNGTMKQWVANPLSIGKRYKIKIILSDLIPQSPNDPGNTTSINFKYASTQSEASGTVIIAKYRTDCTVMEFDEEIEVTEAQPYLYLYYRPFAIGMSITISYQEVTA